MKVFRNGEQVKFSGADTRLYLQTLTATKGSDGVWRVATVKSDPVSRSTYRMQSATAGSPGRDRRESRQALHVTGSRRCGRARTSPRHVSIRRYHRCR